MKDGCFEYNILYDQNFHQYRFFASNYQIKKNYDRFKIWNFLLNEKLRKFNAGLRQSLELILQR